MIQIKSVKRAFDVLDLFSSGDFELSVTQVAAKLRINKSTSARLLSTLEASEILKKCQENRRYRLNSKVLDLAKLYVSNIDLKTVAQPYLEDLNRQTKELIIVHIIKDNQRFSLCWVESSQPIRRAPPEYYYAPLNAGAPSKLLLAFLPDERIEEIIEKEGLPRFTSETITEKSVMLSEVAKIRKLGYAHSRGEHIELIETISAPVRNITGQVIAALSITWVMLPNGQNQEARYLALVRRTADGISQELGHLSHITALGDLPIKIENKEEE